MSEQEQNNTMSKHLQNTNRLTEPGDLKNVHDFNNQKANGPREQYVLLHRNELVVHSLPDGSPMVFDNLDSAELTRKILEKDFANFNCEIVDYRQAIIRLANAQARQEALWKKPFRAIRKAKDLEERVSLYDKALKAFGPHPITLDQQLRFFLKL